MTDANATYVLDKKSVNSKSLFDEIHEFAHAGITDSGFIWSSDTHREAFVELLEEFLEDFVFDGKLDQPNVLCDLRNNSISGMDKGIYVLELRYRQNNCENTTRLIYTVTDTLIKSVKDLVDFETAP